MKKACAKFVAVLALAFSFAPAAQAEPAHLIIHRAANFGTRQALRIWIDGNLVGTIGLGHEFHSRISPGPHTIAIVHTPNRWNVPPTVKHLKVHPGTTYEFTAVWRTDHVYLK